MDASTLPIPDGVRHVKIIDDVREIMLYDIRTEGMVARWDTVIHGNQYHVMEFEVASQGMTTSDWLDKCRSEAILKFAAIENHSTLVK